MMGLRLQGDTKIGVVNYRDKGQSSTTQAAQFDIRIVYSCFDFLCDFKWWAGS
jgi:hypothetical protein